MATQEIKGTFDVLPISLDMGFYDPFSIFQGGFRSDFEKHVKISSFYWKDNHEYLRVLKNLQFNFIEEIPHSSLKDKNYLRFMFISCQSIDDYRAKVRPLILQWLGSMKSKDFKVPYFIFFFENTELRTTADKYLKTNLFNKLKLDFDHKEFNTDNIFKIKSMYPSKDDKVEAWKYISASIKTLLSDSINSKLLFYKDNLLESATIYQSLHQNQDALASYSQLFNMYPYIMKQDFDSIDLHEILRFTNHKIEDNISDTNSKFLLKGSYFRKQQSILLADNITDLVYLKNICRLAQTLLSFLNSLEMCYKRNEISFLLIKQFLSNDHMWKLLKVHKNNSDELINHIGNLKLLQRNELLALGMSKDYFVEGSMSMVDIQFSKDEYKLMDKDVSEILQSKESFINNIIELTQDLISIYSKSSININTIASLSTELALIFYYSTDDYETSCDQLVKSYDFFSTNGWKYIGISLLEVYIENLDKLTEKHGSNVVLQLLSSYVTLAINKSNNFQEDRFRALGSKLQTQKVLKIENLLDIYRASSVYIDEVDTYKFDLFFASKMCCKIDKIKVFMRNEKNETINFFSEAVNVKPSNKITFSCNEILFDDFEVTAISLIIGKFEILQDVNLDIHITEIDSFYDSSLEKIRKNTKVCMRIPTRRYLHSDELLFEIEIGSNNITDIEFIFIKTDMDKIVKNANYKMQLINCDKTIKTLEYNIDESDAQLKFTPKVQSIIEAGGKVQLNIPYFFPPDVSNTLLDVRYIFNFVSVSVSGKYTLCSQRRASFIESLLPIAVAADDIFRSSYADNNKNSKKPVFSLFSHFTINSISTDNPIRIQNVNLSSKKSKIESWKLPKNIVAYMDQGSTFFYKINDFDDQNVTLKIEYNTIKNEIVEIMNLKFRDYLQNSNTFSDGNEVIAIFSSVAHNIWKSLKYKLNFYALTGRIFPIEFNINDISSFMKYIDQLKRTEFKNAITEFIGSLKTMEIDNDFKTNLFSEVKQELLIVVTLPPINMVNVVEYHFDKVLQYLVCEPIDVKVTLDVHILKHARNQINDADQNEKHVRFANSKNKEEAANNGSKYVNLELGFVDQEQKWIISGIKCFEANVNIDGALENQSEHFEYNLTLVPLKPGKLQLPVIEVRNTDDKNFFMELDYKNTSESVIVVSELNKIIHTF